MARIAERFAQLKERGEAALIPFLTAGDPDLETTRQLLRAVARAGADLIELGVPFSDPTADGPAIQRSSARALRKRTSLGQILGLVAEEREQLGVPIILFGYYNPIFHYGPERLCADAQRAGVDGLLVVDLPPEEAAELFVPARARGLDMIFLLAPTSDEGRVRKVLERASGFVYYVSMTGVTGSQGIDTAQVEGMVKKLRALCRLPIGVGFGITSPQEAARVATFADAVVVGSAIVRLIEDHQGDSHLVQRVEDFVRSLKEATRHPG